MKKLSLIVFLLYCSSIICQTFQVKYNYEVKNTILGKNFAFPANLYTDILGKKIYTVRFGIEEHSSNIEDNFLIEKGSYDYMLYSDNSEKNIISDVIGDTTYYFIDNIPKINYQITNETKDIDKIKLKKANAEFRGRKYVIWFSVSDKIKGGPWKFVDLPGLAYEIYDEDGLFKWTLQEIENSRVVIKNPFANKEMNALPYSEYPKLKYNTPVFYQQGVTRNDNMKEIGQKRDGLEKVFEWEK